MAAPSTTAQRAGSASVPSYRRAWMITSLLFFFMLVNYGDKAVLGLAAKPMMDELGMSPSQYGLLSSSFYALFSVSAIIVGILANRRPTKWILAILALIWSLTQLPIVMNMGFVAILASRAVLGAAEGPANPIALHAMQKWFPDHKRNLPTAVINMGASLGVVILSPLITSIIVAFGWKWAFLTMFAIGVVWVVLWLVFAREGTLVDSNETDDFSSSASADRDLAPAPEPTIAYRRIFFSGTGISIIVAGFTLTWGLAILIAWIPVYLSGLLEFSTRTAGLVVVLPWIAATVSILVQGIATDAMMRRGVSTRIARGVYGGVSTLTAGVCLLLMVLVPSIPMKIALLTLTFSAGSPQFGASMSMCAEIAPVHQRAAVMATVSALLGVAGLISPFVTGRLVDVYGDSGFDMSFAITAALMMVGGIVALVLARPDRDGARLRAQAMKP